MLKKVIFILFFIFSSFSFAQEPLHYFLGKDIFSGIQLYSIIEDNDNVIWISSNKGVYRYNGITFENIRSIESSRDSYFGLTKDRNGYIYCYNFSGEVFRVTRKQLKLYYSIPPELMGNNFSINFDNQNHLIISSSSWSIRLSPNKTSTLLKHNKGSFSVKKNDTIYYALSSGNKFISMVSYADNKEAIYKKFAVKYSKLLMYSKLYIHNNTMYCYDTMENKLYKIGEGTLDEVKFPLPKDYDYSSFYSNDEFWLANTKGGVYKISPDIKASNIKANKWFKDYIISGVYTDFENNTWLLTFDNGIIIIPNLKVANYKLSNENLSGIQKIDNSIYVSSRQNIIYKFKNNVFTPTAYLEHDRLETFNIFKKKNIITSSTSIYKNNTKLDNVISFNRGTILLNDTIYAALHNGFYKYDLTNNSSSVINGNRTNAICVSVTKDKIYISSNSGLFVYDFKTVNSIKYKGEVIEPREITAVNDNVWISSKKGIYVVNNEVVVRLLTTNNGLLSNNTEHIKFEKPYVYFTNTKGLQQYNIETGVFNNLVEDYRLTKSIKDFEVVNGTIYALTSNGILTFSFKDAKPNVIPYTTTITEAIANGNNVFLNDTSLSPTENNVEFSFLTTSYRYQKKIDYTYQLIGYDKKPIRAKEGQYIVNYSNLPAGKYTFRVQSSINEQVNKPATVHFSIKQHWYKTTLFKLIVVFLILLILYAIYINRVKAIEQKRKEEQFEKEVAESSLTSLKAQMNPHFMFNAMNSVQSLILKDKKDDAYAYLTKLSQLIRKTLTISDKTWVYIDEEVEQLTNYLQLEQLRFQSDFSYNISVDEALYELKIPSMIIQPFVENSIKHGLLHKDGDKYVNIDFKLKKSILTCVIEDNGIGREASHKINSLNSEKSFSTNAIKKRFELYQDYLNQSLGFEYEDLYNKTSSHGTRVTITIPYQTDDS